MLPLLLGHLMLPTSYLADVRLPINLVTGLGIWLELDQSNSYCDWFRNEHTIQARLVRVLSQGFSHRGWGRIALLCPVWWCMPGIPTLKGQRREDLKFKANLGYMRTPPQKQSSNSQKLSFYTHPQIVSLKLSITCHPTLGSCDPMKFLFAWAFLSSLKSLCLITKISQRKHKVLMLNVIINE